jgi:thiamine kinase
MQLEEALAAARRWVPGSGAVEIQRLGSGLVNESFRVTRGGSTYSLRLPARSAVPLGLDHEWECRVLRCAGAAGVAPPLERCDPMLLHWIEGATWTRDVALQPASLLRMAMLMRRVHTLGVPEPARCLSPADWITRYSRGPVPGASSPAEGARLKGRLDGLRDAVALNLSAFRALPQTAAALCHSDLHLGNLLDAGHRLVLLDWEYAHVSDPFWDLAGWACNTDMDTDGRMELLSAYLGRTPAPEDVRRLGILAWLYDYVCVLWSLVYLAERGGGEPARSVARRAAEVAARLGRDAGGPAG